MQTANGVRIPTPDKIVAIIVTYNPEPFELGRLIDIIHGQVSKVVVVDNASAVPINLGEKADNAISLIQNPSNFGVATAQNIGIAWAKKNSADFVLLFDQDSLPAHDLVLQLCDAAAERVLSGEAIAAVGPTNFDGRWQKALPFVKIEGFGYRRLDCPPDRKSLEVAHVISSGALIPMVALELVGLMRDDLFIDYIDVEWGMRAARAGLKSYGARQATMTHALGNTVVSLGIYKVTMHSPFRDYYLFRNSIWMLRQPWLPLNWKIAEGRRVMLRLVFYSVFGRPWLEQLSWMYRGVRDGILGRTGRYEG